ncbi:hypothetical protein JOD57_001844 [Geodermatophilus bullaregiensis]|nr:hypothetical protein [Geodermatophilus bullaregiensis]
MADGDGAPQEVDVLQPQPGRLPQPQAGEGAYRDERPEPGRGDVERSTDLLGGGDRHGRGGLAGPGQRYAGRGIRLDDPVHDGGSHGHVDVVVPSTDGAGREPGSPAAGGLGHGLDPLLDVRGSNLAHANVGERHGVGRLPSRERGPTFPHLPARPLREPGREGDLPRGGVNVVAGDHGSSDLVEPPLRVNLSLEVAGVLLTVLVPVPRSVGAVRPSRDRCHGSSLPHRRASTNSLRAVAQADARTSGAGPGFASTSFGIHRDIPRLGAVRRLASSVALVAADRSSE